MNMFVQSNYKFTTQAMMHFKVHSSFLFFLSPVISLPLFTIYSQANEATETEKDKNIDIEIVIKGKKKKKEWRQIEEDRPEEQIKTSLARD